MKRFGITFVVLFVLCFCGIAQKQEFVYNLLKENGYTLAKTDNIEGFKCEHYRCVGKQPLRLIIFSEDAKRGLTYGLWKEDPTGQNKKPEDGDRTDRPLGLKIVFKEGPIVHLEETSGYDFPDGSRTSVANYPKWDDYVNRVFNHPLLNVFTSEDFGDVYFGDSPNRLVKWVREYQKSSLDGYAIGDRLYKIKLTQKGIIRKPYAQVLDGRVYYINSSDTIISVTKRENGGYGWDTLFIKYKNGDYVIRTEGTLLEYSIHRNGGLLKYNGKGSTASAVLTFPDGSYYEGTFSHLGNVDERILSFSPIILEFDELEFYTGKWYTSDGDLIVYDEGLTLAEQLAREEASKKANEKAYAELCTKFGKRYVDSALIDGKPIVGMPEELFLAAFKAELVDESQYSKKYRVRGFGIINSSYAMTITDRDLKWTVWVAGGKVYDIKYWN